MGKDESKMSKDTRGQQHSGHLARVVTAAALTTIALALLSLFITTTAVAEEDEGNYVSAAAGELTVEASALAPGAAVTVSGEGFAPASSLRFVIWNVDGGNPVVSQELVADDTGAVSNSFTLPEEMVTSEYLARIWGLTDDGTTLILDKIVQIDGNVEQLTTTTIVTTTTAAADPTAEPVDVENSGSPVAATDDVAGPTPTVDELGDDGTSFAETAAGDDSETRAATSTPSSSSSSSALVLVIVVAVVGVLGTGGFLMRRRATKPF